MGNENNENPVLQIDRNNARELNKIPGVDGHSYDTSELRRIAKEYGKACTGGALVGAAASAIPTAGFGAPAGAAVGCIAGVGFRIYGIGLDTVSLALDKFQQELKRDNNAND